MAKVVVSMTFAAPAERVWQLIGGFHSLADWATSFKSSLAEQGGRVRRLKTAEGAVIVERMESFNEAERQYSYSIVSAPIPVSNYRSTLQVHGAPGASACEARWSGEFDTPPGAEEAMTGAFEYLYQSAFQDLKRVYGF